MPFDPDAAAAPGSGIFGLPFTRDEARVVIVPVPFDATTSYRPGTADGPRAVREASMQVDLFDKRFGRVYEQGLFIEDEDPRVRQWSEAAHADARPLIAKGGVLEDAGDAAALARVNRACEQVNEFVAAKVDAILRQHKIPALLGGEHSVPFGAIEACARAHGSIGVLQIDAHMDLRDAFEGFAWSHASIMHNVVSRLPAVKRLVQVGIRDFGEQEMAMSRDSGGRIVTHYDDDWQERLLEGARFSTLVAEALAPLPDKVYVTVDIDGLEPWMCPHTGTPVAGGLTFAQFSLLLEGLKKSGRTVVGFDLVEVAPGPDGTPEWDANVAARALYKLCGLVFPR